MTSWKIIDKIHKLFEYFSGRLAFIILISDDFPFWINFLVSKQAVSSEINQFDLSSQQIDRLTLVMSQNRNKETVYNAWFSSLDYWLFTGQGMTLLINIEAKETQQVDCFSSGPY